MHLRVCLNVFQLRLPLYILLSDVCADATLTVETQNWYCMSILSSRIAQRLYTQKHLYFPSLGAAVAVTPVWLSISAAFPCQVCWTSI